MIGLSLLLLMSAAPPATSADPLGPARSGQLQCYTPDRASKTCTSLAGYRADGEDRYVNRAESGLDPEGRTILVISSAVRVVSGAVCGTPRAEDLTSGELKIDGNPVAADRAAPVLANLVRAMTSFIGHEICTRYTPSGDGLAAEISIDGARRTDLDQPVIWVSPSDGYRVVAR